MNWINPVSLLLAGASVFAFPAMASAQTAGGAQPAAANEVVVTGSRVITNGNNSPTPVTVVTTTQLEALTPTTIPDALNKLPVFDGSGSATTLGGATSNGTGAFLNLRDFGANRTLILEDGRRVPATAINGTVDTNTLPQMLMQRVDVVTGGASAVYGSDAVTGVVNFILDNKFEGVKMQLQGGIAGRGDDGSYQGGIAAGQSFLGGKLHLEGSYEHFSSEGLGNKFDRPVTAQVWCMPGSGTAAAPFELVENCRQNQYSFGGLIRSGPAAGLEFASNGVLTPFVHGQPTDFSTDEIGGDGFWEINSGLAAYLHSDQAFARADYDIDGNFKLYAQVSGAHLDQGNAFNPISMNSVNFSTANPYLTPAAQATLGAGGSTQFTFSRFFADQNPVQIRSLTTNIDFTIGLKGDLLGFALDGYYTAGRSTLDEYNTGVINRGREFAAADAVVNPATGQVVCDVTLTNPTLYPGCVPINPFGPTAESTAAASYIRGNTQFTLHNNMDDFAGSATRDLFNTWAGPVRMAVSGEYRNLSLSNVSNASPTTLLDCTGLRFGNCVAGTTLVWINNVTANVSADEFIAEAALEGSVPLLKDVFLADSVELNGAVRYADYSISGGATTWKIGLDWHLDNQMSFRFTRSQDIRAPSLYDLYQPLSIGLGGYNDLHTGVNSTGKNVTQGNPNLVPEVAQTTTAGFIYKPSWLPRFSISVDGYNINVDNAITSVSGGNASIQAECENSGGVSPLCALYVRPLPFSNHTAANYPTEILSEELNVAQSWTYGFDTEINYSLPWSDLRASLPGRSDFRLFVSYQPVDDSITMPGQPTVQTAGVAGLATLQATFFADYALGPWTVNWETRWRSSERLGGTPGLYYLGDIAAVAFSDATVTYNFQALGKQASAFLSVQNLFDQQPPPYDGSGDAANPEHSDDIVPGDDVIGRYFTIGAKLRF